MAALFVQRMAIYYNDNHTIGLTFCQIPNTSKHLKFDFKNLPKWQDSTKSGHNCKFVPNLAIPVKYLSSNQFDVSNLIIILKYMFGLF